MWNWNADVKNADVNKGFIAQVNFSLASSIDGLVMAESGEWKRKQIYKEKGGI